MLGFIPYGIVRWDRWTSAEKARANGKQNAPVGQGATVNGVSA